MLSLLLTKRGVIIFNLPEVKIEILTCIGVKSQYEENKQYFDPYSLEVSEAQ